MLAAWEESYDKLSVFKSRDIILLTKVHIVKAMLFPVVMCRCESWTIKMAVKVKAKIAQSCPTLCDAMDSSTPSFPVQLSHPYMTTGKSIALTR